MLCDGGRGGIRTHGRVTADGFRDRCFQPDSATLPHGAPGENRTHHELLCRQPLRQLASGANLLAGDQGFEPCRNGFGVRRSSYRVMSPVVRAAGFEPAREPGLSRPPLPDWATRAWRQRSELNRQTRWHNLVARPGVEPGESLQSE